jgi:2-octaprenyl-6-methoxyphenol hydroxylase
MGNAAHTIHPVAGQGFNLCLRDADVLVRFLMAQLANSDDIGAPENLLTYEQSRLKDQQRVIKFCDSVVRGFSNQNPILKLIRNTGLIAFDVIPGVKPLVANYAMGLKA